MRNTLVILLAALHLTGNTEIGQLFRIPNLIHHFFQHHRIDPSVGFIEFIAMHYGGDDGTDADDDMDNQLPCHSQGYNTVSWVYSPMTSECSGDETVPDIQTERNSHIVEGLSSEHVRLVLQPPRPQI